MNKTRIALTEEKFAEIYTSKKFRNQVAYAHICNTADFKFSHKQTCSYPIEYIVTDEQIELAKKELEHDRAEMKKNHYNDLVFVGMGMDYEATFEDDICNHRIRTEFLDKDGNQRFVEFSKWNANTHVDFSIDRDLEMKRNAERSNKQDYYRFANLEGENVGVYSKTNILNVVNRYFNSKFKNIIIDSFTTRMGEQYTIICESPK